MKIKKCSDCGITFICSEGENNKTCWCNDYPPIMPLDFQKDCRCPACLKKIVIEKIEAFVNTITPKNAINCVPEKFLAGKVMEGIDYEMKDGKKIYTKWYHLKKGNCCDSGCINCPYKEEEKK